MLNMEPVHKLQKDLKQASVTLSRQEVRYLVDSYYSIQEYRKASGNQIRALEESGEPHEIIRWFFDNTRILEQEIKKAMDVYSASQPVGIWSRQITGIGPVIAAGLIAHIDIDKAHTAGAVWRYAGQDPSVVWPKKEKVDSFLKDKDASEQTIFDAAQRYGRDFKKLLHAAAHDKNGNNVKLTKDSIRKAISKRPWNASFKTLCWKIGESFVKQGSKSFYNQIYAERKAIETEKNENLEFAEQAAQGAQRVGKSTDSYKYYVVGKLPPGHIHARAKRYAVKLFLSHWHEVAYELHYGTPPPDPYPLTHLGHVHRIERPV